MATTYDQMSPEQLLAEYNELERKLFSMGRDYQEVPEGEFDKIEGWLNQAGYSLEQPPDGLSSLKKLDK